MALEYSVNCDAIQRKAAVERLLCGTYILQRYEAVVLKRKKRIELNPHDFKCY